MLKKKFFKTIDECEVTFEVTVEAANSVALVCEHNGWEPIQMKQAKKGPFRTKIRLPKEGQFQFRYLVDGQQWHNDKTADAFWGNEHGSENSVISTVV
ncbi:MAG: 1,4-alpha-glucan branching protein [Chloroflexi bacterium]|nr:1,4-alpha-glucan branching protein [Chloroflexota bacterium]